MTRDEQIDLWRRLHYARFDKALNIYESSILNKLRRMVKQYKGKLVAAKTIDELEAQFAELSRGLAEEVQQAASVVGSSALGEAYNVLSIDGRSPVVRKVSLSPPEVKQTIKLGRIIEEMAAAYNYAIKRPLLEADKDDDRDK